MDNYLILTLRTLGTVIIHVHVVMWQGGHNVMPNVEYVVYFKSANLELLKIISFRNKFTNKMIVAPAIIAFDCRAKKLLKMIVVSEKCSRETY